MKKYFLERRVYGKREHLIGNAEHYKENTPDWSTLLGEQIKQGRILWGEHFMSEEQYGGEHFLWKEHFRESTVFC